MAVFLLSTAGGCEPIFTNRKNHLPADTMKRAARLLLDLAIAADVVAVAALVGWLTWRGLT